MTGVGGGATASYVVAGMTCQHCVASVTEEISEVEGVTGVEVDLGSGEVTVSSDRPVPEEAVRVAVEVAGYRVVESP